MIALNDHQYKVLMAIRNGGAKGVTPTSIGVTVLGHNTKDISDKQYEAASAKVTRPIKKLLGLQLIERKEGRNKRDVVYTCVELLPPIAIRRKEGDEVRVVPMAEIMESPSAKVTRAVPNTVRTLMGDLGKAHGR